MTDQDTILRLVVLEVIDALMSDESILDHTKERLASAAFQLDDMSRQDAPGDAEAQEATPVPDTSD